MNDENLKFLMECLLLIDRKESYDYTPRDFKKITTAGTADVLKAMAMSAQVNENNFVFIQCLTIKVKHHSDHP